MVEKVKVVLDTNVWISIVFNKTLARELLPLINDDKITVYLSRALLKELGSVLTYPRIEELLERSDVDKRTALSAILRTAVMVRAKESVYEIKNDPADNRVLECAVAAGATFIVTGDKHLLTLKRFRGVEIVSPNEFMERQES